MVLVGSLILSIPSSKCNYVKIIKFKWFKIGLTLEPSRMSVSTNQPDLTPLEDHLASKLTSSEHDHLLFHVFLRESLDEGGPKEGSED